MQKVLTQIYHFKWLPNFLTICNSLCGFAAILYALKMYEKSIERTEIFAVCAYIILFAMVFDALDGFAARKLNASSLYGVQMDSLSDMITFGLTPAVVVAIMTHSLRVKYNHNISQMQEMIVYILCSFYIGGAALRLAKYNIKAMLSETESNTFSGLPSPGAAAAICGTILLAKSNPCIVKYLPVYLPIYAAILGLLMVSTLPYPHVGKMLFSIFHNRKSLIIFIISIIIIGILQIQGIFILITIYVLSGIINLIFIKKGKQS